VHYAHGVRASSPVRACMFARICCEGGGVCLRKARGRRRGNHPGGIEGGRASRRRGNEMGAGRLGGGVLLRARPCVCAWCADALRAWPRAWCADARLRAPRSRRPTSTSRSVAPACRPPQSPNRHLLSLLSPPQRASRPPFPPTTPALALQHASRRHFPSPRQPQPARIRRQIES
jgi:hypothetical protein